MMNSKEAAARTSLYTAILASVYTPRAYNDTLPAIADDLESVPEAARGLYVKEGDSYVLNIDDKGFKQKLGEFRNNNVKLLKDMEELKSKLDSFDGIDPKAFREMEKKLEDQSDKTMLDEGKLEELLEVRTERMRKEFGNKLTAMEERAVKAEGDRDTFRGRLESTLIDRDISTAVSDVGTVKKGAMADLLSRARGTWKLGDDGKPVALDASGSPRIGTDGKNPLTMKEWALEQVSDAPFLFEDSKGGGSNNKDRESFKGSATVLAKDDRKGFSRNLEDIAKGKKKVAI